MDINSIATLGLEFVAFCIEILLWMVFCSVLFGIVRKVLSVEDTTDEREKIVDEVMKLIHRVKQEQHGECYYWFDADTDEFLAQGTTDTEIKDQLKKRFQGHAFIIDEKRALAGPELKLVTLEELKMDKNRKIA